MLSTARRGLRGATIRGLRALFRLARSASRRIPFLRQLRARTNRRILHLTLLPLARALTGGNQPVELDGLRLWLPPELLPTYLIEDYEPEMRRWLDDLLRPGMVVADVGANIGYISLFAARRVGPSGRVVAVEPGPDNLSFLRRNVEANRMPWIEIIPCAAGAVKKRDTLYLGTIGTTHSLHGATPGARTLTIDVAALDEIVPGRLDLAKIDAEGSELDVLAGMSRLLADNPDLRLILEWSPHRLIETGRSPDAIPVWLREHRFRVTVIEDESWDLPALMRLARRQPKGRPWPVNLLAEQAR